MNRINGFLFFLVTQLCNEPIFGVQVTGFVAGEGIKRNYPTQHGISH